MRPPALRPVLPDPASLAGFAFAAFIVALSPGPDNMAILSWGIARGRHSALGFAVGCALGCLTHIGWAVLGVAALLAASPKAMVALKFAGAAYLAYLGVMSLRSKGTAASELKTFFLTGGDSFAKCLLMGFGANAINPKVAIFFLAFLPPFVRPEAPATPQMILLGLLFIIVTLCVFLPLALAAAAVGGWLRTRPAAGMWLDRGAGVLFLGLAGYVLLG